MMDAFNVVDNHKLLSAEQKANVKIELQRFYAFEMSGRTANCSSTVDYVSLAEKYIEEAIKED